MGWATFSGERIHDSFSMQNTSLIDVDLLLPRCSSVALSSPRCGKTLERGRILIITSYKNHYRATLPYHYPDAVVSCYHRPYAPCILQHNYSTTFSYNLNNCSDLDTNLHHPAACLLGDYNLTMYARGTDTKRLILTYFISISTFFFRFRNTILK